MTVRSRRGFSLLEVIVAIGILSVSLTLMVEIQANAVKMTSDAERFVTATNLAQEKMTEVRLRVEEEGFYADQEIFENGDFDDFGDDALDIEFGEALENYHWRYSVIEIDLGMAGDIANMAGDYNGGEGLPPGIPGMPDTAAGGGGNVEGGPPGLGDLGVSNDMITDYLAKYLRHVEVEVWWGDDGLDEAQELKNVVLLTGHVINPTGALMQPPEMNP